MFIAAAACLGKATGGTLDHDTSCCSKDVCQIAFVLLSDIHAENNDGHESPDGHTVQTVLARSQVPDQMIEVLRRAVCSHHAVDPKTGKMFWRIKRLENRGRKAAS